MSVYLANAIPNCWMPTEGNVLTVSGISLNEARRLTCRYDHEQDYDDNLAPLVFNCTSLIGHDSVATALGARLYDSATLGGQPIPVEIPVNRVMLDPQPGDVVVVGLVKPPRRLEEGQVWIQQELAQMPINWVRLDF